jgi:hypothetical protein
LPESTLLEERDKTIISSFIEKIFNIHNPSSMEDILGKILLRKVLMQAKVGRGSRGLDSCR